MTEERTAAPEQRRTPMTDNFVSIRRWEDGQGPLDAWARFARGLERALAEEKESHRISIQLAESLQKVTERRADIATKEALASRCVAVTPGWVSVKDSLPPKPLRRTHYIVVAPDDGFRPEYTVIARWTGECFKAADDDNRIRVTHWMPFPTKPSESEREQQK